MTVLELIRDYLTTHGYDGLCDPDIECGCLLTDLQPCGEDPSHCQPGYRIQGDDGWGIYLTKPQDPGSVS